MSTDTLDDLELELRKLPGVRSIGFSDREDVLLVQVHVVPEHVESGLALQATRIASRHSERPVAVELVRWRTLHVPVASDATRAPAAPAPEAPAAAAPEPMTPPVDLTEEAAPIAGEAIADRTVEPEVVPAPVERRVRLLAVLTFPDTDELEVHLTFDGKRSIGRAAASRGLLGAVEATVDALATFVPDLGAVPSWARTLESAAGEPFLVGVGLEGPHGQSRHGLATGSSPIEAAARSTLHAVNRLVARAVPSPA